MAKKEKSADAKGKGKGDKKAKKGKKGKGGADGQGASIASHPRAKGSIRRAKGWAGIVGFALAAFVSVQASVPLFQAGLRALAAGVVGYMLAWWIGVLVWRQLILAEHKAAYEIIERRRNEEIASAETEPTRTPQPTG